MLVKLVGVVSVLRSKNAGPFELTFDIVFKDWDVFNKVCEKDIINSELFAQVYNIPVSDVLNVIKFSPAKAIKVTIKRPLISGDLGDTDVYGAQQHAPLLFLELDL